MDKISVPEVSRLNIPTTRTSAVPTPGNSTPADSDYSDAHVSDLDSDIDLDELVPAYLRIKSKLYEIDPKLVESDSRRQARMAKSKNAIPASYQTPTVRKLFSQLQQLASDALFDEQQAEAQWPAKRNQIAQEKATKRQRDMQASTPDKNLENPIITPIVLNQRESSPITTIPDTVGSEDEADLLGDMFSVTLDHPVETKPTPEGARDGNVVLRDFGKTSGVSPRKLLEETIRSRSADLSFLLCY